MKFLLIVTVSLVTSSPFYDQGFVKQPTCFSQPDEDAPENIKTTWDKEPLFEMQRSFGRKYTITTETARVPIVHLWGSPRQMGNAHGILMRDEILTFCNELEQYLLKFYVDEVLASFGPHIPQDMLINLAQDLMEKETKILMDTYWNDENIESYIGDDILEELYGIAEAISNNPEAIDYHFQKTKEFHAWTERTSGQGSIIGAWGDAVGRSENGGLVHARTVDWVMDAPFRNYPQITVYHPTTGHNFVTIGFTGFIGSISAINDQQVVISASNVQFPDESFGSNIKNGPGLPFVFLVREIAQFDNTFKNAEERIISTPRTLNLILGLGDGKIEKFNAVQYSRSITNFMDDTTPLPACAQSENIHNVVYIGLDWCCPGYTQKLAQQLLLAKDTINPNSVKETVLPKTEIGSVQSVIFNVIDELMFVAFARPNKAFSNGEAYRQSYYQLDVRKLFDEVLTPQKLS